MPDDLPEIEIGCEFRTRRLSEQPEGGAADARKEEGRGNEAVVGAVLEPLGRRSRNKRLIPDGGACRERARRRGDWRVPAYHARDHAHRLARHAHARHVFTQEGAA